VIYVFLVLFAVLGALAIGSALYMGFVNIAESQPWYLWTPVALNALVGALAAGVFVALVRVL
jgi:hypothetical protein